MFPSIRPMVTGAGRRRIAFESGGRLPANGVFSRFRGKVRIETLASRVFDSLGMSNASRTGTKIGDGTSRLSPVRLEAGAADPLGAGRRAAGTGASGGAARSASGATTGSTARAKSTPTTSNWTTAPRRWPASSKTLERENMRQRGRDLLDGARRGPDHRRRLPLRLSCSAAPRRRRPGRAAAAVPASKPARGELALAFGDHLQRPGADPLQRPGRGDPLAERLGARRVERAAGRSRGARGRARRRGSAAG